jgi:hypothetical protein
MTGVLGNVGQVASLVLLVLGVVAMHAGILLLWRPRRDRPRQGGSVSGHGRPDRRTSAPLGHRIDREGLA